MLFDIFAPLTTKIATGAALALLVALAVVMWRADAISGQRDAAREAFAMSEAKHTITRQSLDTLAEKLTAYVSDGDARKSRVADLALEAKAGAEAMRAEATEIEAAVAVMCETPDINLESAL